MKSFFKKLAFVMALAMVVSLAAPAANNAFAAEAKEFTYKYQNGLGTSVKTINLAKTGDTVDLKFVGISDYKNYVLQWMGYGTGFEIDAKTGVITATADEGEGLVWLSVGDDQTYVSDPIKVTVGALTATIGKQDKSNKNLTELTLKIGEKEDLAFFGITDWNLGKYGYKWVVKDTSILDVDQKTGEITALKAGETTVTFLAPNKFNPANVVVTNSLKVTVVPTTQPGIVAEQTTENDFVINFTDLAAANYNENNIEVVRIFPADKDTNGDGVIDARDAEAEEAFFIKPVTVDKDNNIIKVATYADFVDGATYEVRIGKYTSRFVASVGKVVSVELKTTQAYVASDGVAAVPAVLSVVLRDANGIDVSEVEVAGLKNKDNVIYEINGASDTVYLYGNEVTFVEVGAVTAYAYFDYYNITERKASNPCQVSGVKHVDYVAKVIAWRVVNESNANDKINWNDVVKNNEPLWVASGDTDRHVVALLEDSRGNYFTTHTYGTTAYTGKKFNDKPVYAMEYVSENIGDSYVFAANGYTLEFETLNPDNLLMYKDGEVVTYKKTTSAIKLNLYNVYDSSVKAEIASVPLTVKDARYVKYLETSDTAVNAVTETFENRFDSITGMFTKPQVTITVYDQYGDRWYGASSYELSLVKDSAYKTTEISNLETYIDTVNVASNNNSARFTLTLDAKAIRECLVDANPNINSSNRNAVAFKLTEKNSGRFVTVKVNLQVPKYAGDNEVAGGDYITLDTIRTNNLSVYDSKTIGTTVDQTAYFHNGSFVTAERKANIDLYISSKTYNVGYELAPMFIANESVDRLNASNYPGIAVGDKVLIVTGPDNKVVPSAAVGAIDVVTNATSGALGVKMIPDTDDQGGTYYTYELVAAAKNADDSMAYLKTGRYTVQVRTVKAISAEATTLGKITLESLSDHSATTNVKYITVTNTNDKITFTGQTTRDLRESADSVEEVVANAFTFNRGSNSWYSGGDLEGLIYDVDREVSDGYVYIKSVIFKVPVDKTKNTTNGYYYYTVNIGRSVKVSTDLFYFD